MKINNRSLSFTNAGIFFALGVVVFFSLACTEKTSQQTVLDGQSSISVDRVLNRGNGPDPETLDPQMVRSESAGNVVRDLYEGLLTEAADGSLVAGVAETWSYNPQNLCYNFNLRADAKWSNGEAVTAFDFKRGMQFALDANNNSPYSELLKPIINIDVISSQQLTLCTSHPVPYFLELLVLPVSFPRHTDADKKQHLYNGAYYLEDRVPQDQVVLKKNKHFHSSISVYFEQVNFIITEDPSSELKRFLAKEMDVTATVPPADVKRLKVSHPLELKIAPVLNSYFYGFNSSQAPFKDNPNLRQALSLAIDRDVLAEKILGTGEQAAWTLVPPGMRGYVSPDSEYASWTKEQRLQVAKQLYQEAGYSQSNPLKFELRYNTSLVHKKIAVALASMWKKSLGVQVDLYNEEWKVFIENRRNKNTQLFRSGWIADVNDASNYLELFSSSHPLNDYAYSNERFEQLLDSAKTATSKRTSILRTAEEQLLADHAIIPLYFYVSKHMVNPAISGWEDNSLDHHLSRYINRTIN